MDQDQDPQSSRRQDLQPPPHDNHPPRRLSPAASRTHSLAGPSTPLAEGSAADDYFDPLSQAHSHHEPPAPRLDQSAQHPHPPPQLRRLEPQQHPPEAPAAPPAATTGADGYHGGRPRSISQPTSGGGVRPGDASSSFAARNSRRLPPQTSLPRLTEEGSRPTMAELGIPPSPLSPTVSLPERTHSLEGEVQEPVEVRGNRMRRMSRLFWPGFARREQQVGEVPNRPATTQPEDEYHDQLVDYLDTIDPEVQTLSTLTNVQNSLFIPDLGPLINRRPTYVLSPRDLQHIRPVSAEVPAPPPEPPHVPEEPEEPMEPIEELPEPRIQRSDTITSRLTDSHYAALPHGKTLEGWTAEEKWELDDHVRHMLHSRRSRWKRRMKGFGQYVRRPLGFFVTLYATLITLFGLAWVLFLIGWIYVGDQQGYTIHIIDSVLVALFAIMGDGLAPFRAVDTYHMFFVVRYTRMIEKAAKASGSGNNLQKNNSRTSPSSDEPKEKGFMARLRRSPPPETQEEGAYTEPEPEVRRRDWADGPPLPYTDGTAAPPAVLASERHHNGPTEPDLETASSDISDIYSPLTEKQRKSLLHHQKKLAKSHSFYKPEETFTHYSFPLGYLMAIVILLDCHSCLQISLGATTWSIDYHKEKLHQAVTSTILAISITCNITAGLVITIGDRKTRKKDIHDLMSRQELTDDAIKHLEHKRKKEQDKLNKSGSNSDQEKLNGEGSGSDKERPGHEDDKMKWEEENKNV
ncbi:integral membrane protein [Purpureocillium lavendulum]|uniref:Integral membrane protein n=1 Tax=Purpureocillium lavendulum TaxID=1247861 RepID=A0AB34FP30_9HYPO|nr:integral membrane protein [Purpureocillium lavendulum]